MKNKKGVSPIIATVLLVVIVMVLILIIFIWARGIIGEVVQKQERNVEQVCGEVNLRVDYVGDNLQLTNVGNIPIYGLELRKIGIGLVDSKRVGGEDGRLDRGASKALGVEYVGGDYDHIEVYPVLLGETDSGKKLYTCQNNVFKAYSE